LDTKKKNLKRTIGDIINDSISGIPSKSSIEQQNLKLQKISNETESAEEILMKKKDKQKEVFENELEDFENEDFNEEKRKESDFIPKLQIINGQIVIDQASLTKKQKEINFKEQYEYVNEDNRKITSSTFSRHKKGDKWSKVETEKFYNLLRQVIFFFKFSLDQILRSLQKCLLVEQEDK
jgi:transcription factor TFIIIB component B''